MLIVGGPFISHPCGSRSLGSFWVTVTFILLEFIHEAARGLTHLLVALDTLRLLGFQQ